MITQPDDLAAMRLARGQREPDAPILARWLEALRRESPNLPQPIAVAMALAVTRGPLGQVLRQIELGLIEIERADLTNLTGSEVRMLAAILREMNGTVMRLDAEIARLYPAKED